MTVIIPPQTKIGGVEDKGVSFSVGFHGFMITDLNNFWCTGVTSQYTDLVRFWGQWGQGQCY